MEDEFDVYGDLDEFEETVEKKNQEFLELETKVRDAEEKNEQLLLENKKLEKTTKKLIMNMQILLDTARAEIARKNNEIDELRRNIDNLTFRRGMSKKDASPKTNAFRSNKNPDKVVYAPKKTHSPPPSHANKAEVNRGTSHESNKSGQERPGYRSRWGRSQRSHSRQDRGASQQPTERRDSSSVRPPRESKEPIASTLRSDRHLKESNSSRSHRHKPKDHVEEPKRVRENSRDLKSRPSNRGGPHKTEKSKNNRDCHDELPASDKTNREKPSMKLSEPLHPKTSRKEQEKSDKSTGKGNFGGNVSKSQSKELQCKAKTDMPLKDEGTKSSFVTCPLATESAIDMNDRLGSTSSQKTKESATTPGNSQKNKSKEEKVGDHHSISTEIETDAVLNTPGPSVAAPCAGKGGEKSDKTTNMENAKALEMDEVQKAIETLANLSSVTTKRHSQPAKDEGPSNENKESSNQIPTNLEIAACGQEAKTSQEATPPSQEGSDLEITKTEATEKPLSEETTGEQENPAKTSPSAAEPQECVEEESQKRKAENCDSPEPKRLKMEASPQLTGCSAVFEPVQDETSAPTESAGAKFQSSTANGADGGAASDSTYMEIDAALQCMFQSPPHPLHRMSTPRRAENYSPNEDTGVSPSLTNSLLNPISPEKTLDRESTKAETTLEDVDHTLLNTSGSSEARLLKLGHSDYLVEKDSESNVTKIVITRNRRKKKVKTESS